MSAVEEVADAAARLVAAFGSHRTADYFGSFAPDATFLFYTADHLLGSRAEYESLWSEWEASGFHVEECQSLDGRVDLLTDDVAVFTHRVRTTVLLEGAMERLGERETIVFRRGAAGWLGVHEHLSPDPLSLEE
jgi:hypothetical protein